jgi:2,4-dienoyl-CoA reductase-like NADH-dependent reductase (Old Yellow Enzyme family)
MPGIFDEIKIRELVISNRIWLSPMCQYSSIDGIPNNWHLVHLGKYAMGKVGLIMTEASGISPTARSTNFDTGIWNEEQVQAWKEIVNFVHNQGSKIGIQLWHSGQKGSTTAPWQGQDYVPESAGGWKAIAPSEIAFGKLPVPRQISHEEIKEIVGHYRAAAKRALRAEFDVVEIHAAHGYLIHSFLSPITNKRQDEYGGSFENRIRFLIEVVAAIREVWPDTHPLFLRTSSYDWVKGGWSSHENAELAKILLTKGIDLIDCSSGGITADITYPVSPGYQVQFANDIKQTSSMLTCAVGMITDARFADEIVRSNQTDAVMLGRELLRNPNWVLHAATELDHELEWLNQYKQGKPRKK